MFLPLGVYYWHIVTPGITSHCQAFSGVTSKDIHVIYPVEIMYFDQIAKIANSIDKKKI